jgi:hypothetical protein
MSDSTFCKYASIRHDFAIVTTSGECELTAYYWKGNRDIVWLLNTGVNRTYLDTPLTDTVRDLLYSMSCGRCPPHVLADAIQETLTTIDQQRATEWLLLLLRGAFRPDDTEPNGHHTAETQA